MEEKREWKLEVRVESGELEGGGGEVESGKGGREERVEVMGEWVRSGRRRMWKGGREVGG